MKRLRVLIACESSGSTRDAFLAMGHDAMSCDLLATVIPGPHHQGDVREILHKDWDMIIAHPTCTYLSSSGLHWNTRPEGIAIDRAGKTEDAIRFARMFIDGAETAHIPMRAVENPIGCLSSRVRKPDQIIQPYQYGDDASKATCLWLCGLPLLVPTCYIEPRIVNGRPRWANQTDSGQNKLAPSADRWRLRSVTYQGIANAFANQWGRKTKAYYQASFKMDAA
jgi:hypothetical protein